MKRKLLIFSTFTFLVLVFLLFQNCGESEPDPEPNKAPSCSITSPSNNAAIELGTTVTITVSANDSDGSVVSVKISIDNASVATLQTSPYTYAWNTSRISTGAHTIAAVATDDGGLTASSEITVNVAADVPIVTTADVTEITGTTATSGGNVTEDGGADVTGRGVVWGESSGPTLASNSGSTEDGTSTGAFTSSLTDLTAATTYYVRAYATNSGGTSYGEEKSFMTTGLPVVETGMTFSDITNNSAVGSGEVTDDGGSPVTARGLVWGPWGSDVTVENNSGFTTDGTGVGAFTSSITGLTRLTQYSVRAYATNSAGTAYGTGTHFTTLPDPPVVTLSDITEIGAHVALCSVTVTDDGGATSVSSGVAWSTSPNPDQAAHDGQWYNSTDAILTELQPETMYYVRAYATNDNGTKWVYSEEKSFTTLAISQTIQTGSFTDTRDSKQYATVTINGQAWMAENLAYLPEVCGVDTECGYWVYDYDETDVATAKTQPNFTEYGVLYNWEMAKTACPTGWHLPTSDEWAFLEINIGYNYSVAYSNLNRNNYKLGNKLKEEGNTHWIGTNFGTNEAKFTALPGGQRDIITTNSFKWLGAESFFWTTTTEGSPELHVIFRQVNVDVYKARWSKDPYEKLGLSVRCVQD